MTEHNPVENLEQKIMADITSGRVKLRSRYIFWSEKFGLGSAVVLTILLAALAFTLTLFYLVSADSLTYLEFGNPGWWAFLESFPFPLIITTIVFILLGGLLLTKTGRIYRFSYRIVALAILGASVLIGTALAATNIADTLTEQTFIRPMMHPRLGEHTSGVAGKVMTVETRQLTVRSPRSLVIVHTSTDTKIKDPEKLVPGVFIVSVGEWDDDSFEATNIKIVKPEDLRLLRKAVRPMMPQPQREHGEEQEENDDIRPMMPRLMK